MHRTCYVTLILACCLGCHGKSVSTKPSNPGISINSPKKENLEKQTSVSTANKSVIDDELPVEKGGSVPVTEDSFLENDVTFWLVKTDAAAFESDFSYEATKDQLSQYLRKANKIYKSSGIKFNFKDMKDITLSGDELNDFAEGITPENRIRYLDLLLQAGQINQNTAGWNVILSKSWSTGGTYFSGTKVIVMAEKNAKGEVRRPTILAHEIGHSLGLEHTSFEDKDCNLMTTGDCGTFNPQYTDAEGVLIKKLNDCQVKIIRNTAANRTPAQSLSDDCNQP